MREAIVNSPSEQSAVKAEFNPTMTRRELLVAAIAAPWELHLLCEDLKAGVGRFIMEKLSGKIDGSPEVGTAENQGFKVKIDVILAPHATAKDFDPFRLKMEEADVIILETLGWDQNLLRFYQRISDGQSAPPPSDIDDSFSAEIQRVLYNSKKSVYFIDVPQENRELIDQFEKAKRDYAFSSVWIEGSLSEKLVQVRAAIRQYAAFQRAREDYMIGQLSDLIPRLSPIDQGSKEEIKVDIFLGLVHTPFFHRLAQDQSVEANLSWKVTPPVVFSHSLEALRRYWFLDDSEHRYPNVTEPSDELILQTLLEKALLTLYGERLFSASSDVVKIQRLARQVISQFAPSEIEETFELVRQHGQKAIEDGLPRPIIPATQWTKLQDLIEKGLAEKSIRLPQTEAEVDLLLQKTLGQRNQPTSPTVPNELAPQPE